MNSLRFKFIDFMLSMMSAFTLVILGIVEIRSGSIGLAVFGLVFAALNGFFAWQTAGRIANIIEGKNK